MAGELVSIIFRHQRYLIACIRLDNGDTEGCLWKAAVCWGKWKKTCSGTQHLRNVYTLVGSDVTKNHGRVTGSNSTLRWLWATISKPKTFIWSYLTSSGVMSYEWCSFNVTARINLFSRRKERCPFDGVTLQSVSFFYNRRPTFSRGINNWSERDSFAISRRDDRLQALFCKHLRITFLMSYLAFAWIIVSTLVIPAR